VTVPVRVIQSREDNRVTVAGTTAAVARLGSPIRDVVWRTGAGHVLSADHGREEVWALVADWLDVPGAGATSRIA
jgi:esterase/lipase